MNDLAVKTMARIDPGFNSLSTAAQLQALRAAIIDDPTTLTGMALAAAAPIIADGAAKAAQGTMDYLYDWIFGNSAGTTKTGTEIVPYNPSFAQSQMSGNSGNNMQMAAIPKYNPIVQPMDSGSFAQAQLTSMYKPSTNMIFEEQKYRYDAVNTEYIKAFVTPEDQTARRPLLRAVKTSLTTASFQCDINTNSAGNCGIYVCPKNVVGDASTPARSFIIRCNANTFTPATGLNNGTESTVPGPLFGTTNSIEQYMMSTFSLRVLPTVSALNE